MNHIHEYIQHLELNRNLSPSTLEAYRRDLEQFWQFAAEQCEILERRWNRFLGQAPAARSHLSCGSPLFPYVDRPDLGCYPRLQQILVVPACCRDFAANSRRAKLLPS